LEPLIAGVGGGMVAGVRPTLRAAAVAITALVPGCGAAPERPVSGTARATTAPSHAACRRSVIAGLAAVARRIHQEVPACR
jgi:hypothetical protein